MDTPQGADDTVGQAKPVVLLIEDDADVAYVVRLLLEDEGYRVEWREDGRSGLEAAEALHPAVIVLDLRLPGIPGPQVLRAIKAAPATRRTPVVVLSAVADRLDPALRAMVRAVLPKPTDAQELFDAIKGCLDGAARDAPAADGGAQPSERTGG